MRGRWFLAGLCAAVLPAAAGAADLAVYGNLPTIDNVVISPDGKLLAYETDYQGGRAVLVAGIDDHKIHGGIKSNGQKIRYLMWADNDHLLTTASTTHPAIGVIAPKEEWFLTTSYSVSTGRQVLLMGNVTSESMNVTVGPPQPRTVEGRTLVYVTGITFQMGNGLRALFSVDPDSGRVRMIETGRERTLWWTVDEDGKPVAKTSYDDSKQMWSLAVRHDGDWHDALTLSAPIDTPDVLGITPDGGSVLVSMPTEDDKQIRIADGAEVKAIDFGSDYNRAITDPATHRLIGSERLDISYHYHFLEHADQAAWNAIADAYSGENVELVSWSADRKRVVIRVDGYRDGSAYELVDLNAHASVHIGPVYRGIGTFDVARVKLISYPAADGLTIPAYLTLPSGKGEKNLPLVVLAHGGPAARDEPEFDWWSQALASRGYAVLQPEFRGSAGFGLDFLDAGFGQWGRKMQTDLSDGVRYLAKQGTIDPKRVCIVGASYGGYAALAGATLDHGVYRCAVAVAGVADLRGFLKWNRNREQSSDTQTLRYWDRFLGIEDYDDPKLKEISPLVHAADADIPILLIHGHDDTVVPIAQSEDMEDALKGAHKSVNFVRLDGEDHWLSRPETRLKMLTETVNFLEANDPPN